MARISNSPITTRRITKFCSENTALDSNRPRSGCMPKLRALVAFIVVAAASFGAHAAAKPNIIFILADDLGYGEVGCFGQKVIQTPNLDRMAREGLKFTQFYAGSTVCAPSRAVLMTGKHTGHVSVRGNGGVAKQ